MPPENARQPKLLDQVRAVCRARHLSHRTEDAYVYHIKHYILFHQKRHPKEMSADEITAYLTDLAVRKRVSASTQNKAFCALLFLYQNVLKIDLPRIECVTRAKRPQRKPVVFTLKEVKSILDNLTGTAFLIASLLYTSGLRLSEALRLRVKDIDFETEQIIVRDGKGEKDRITMLPHSLINPLKVHLTKVKSLHTDDLKRGFGAVWLPYALSQKYRNAERE
jgi:integrase